MWVSDEDVMTLTRAMNLWSIRPVGDAAGSLLEASLLPKLDPAMIADDGAFAAELHFALHGSSRARQTESTILRGSRTRTDRRKQPGGIGSR
jgi:hypothetical protein